MAIKFCRPVTPSMELVAQYLNPGVDAGHLSNFGPAYKELAARLKTYLNLEEGREVVITSSGHTALMAAYAVLGVQRPLIPAFTFESTRSAATLQGIQPILCDVNPHTGCIDTKCIEEHPLDSFDAVVAVCALSTIPELRVLHDFCQERGKKLIIDGAATLGTPGIANYGDAFCYSFHATKSFSVGEGGAVALSSENADLCRSYINFGFNSEKDIVLTGINAKVSEYTCSVALALLDVFEEEASARLRNAELYRQYIGHLIPETTVKDTVYSFLPTFMTSRYFSTQMKYLLLQEEVESISYYRPLKPLPVSEDLYRRSVCLPVHSGLTESDIDMICTLMSKL